MTGGSTPTHEVVKQVWHPPTPKDQPLKVDYRIDTSPPWPEAILLGFQHYLVMLGTTVMIATCLVPLMGGGNEETARVFQTMLFVAGLNTLFQTLFGTRLPAVIGGSNTFVCPTISIILAGRYSDIVDPHERFERIMRGTQGALIVASMVQIILGFSGLWRAVEKLETALSSAPLITLIGVGRPSKSGFRRVANCVEIGLPHLILLILFSQYVPRKFPGRRRVFVRFAALVSVAIVWLYAHALTVGGAHRHRAPKTQKHCRTDSSGLVSGAPWIRVPYPFQWGVPTFDAGEAFATMVASFVGLVESSGSFKAVARYAGDAPLPPCVLSHGIGWQGIGILLDGLFGTANGSSVSDENAGLLGQTRVGSLRVVQISAGFMIFFSIFGKLGAVFASIPAPIGAALSCLFSPYVGGAGLSKLQCCDLNTFRSKFILGFAVFMGLSVPRYFDDYTSSAGYGPVNTRARWFNDMINVIFSSEPFVGGSVAFFLDNTLDRHDCGCDGHPHPPQSPCCDGHPQSPCCDGHPPQSPCCDGHPPQSPGGCDGHPPQSPCGCDQQVIQCIEIEIRE